MSGEYVAGMELLEQLRGLLAAHDRLAEHHGQQGFDVEQEVLEDLAVLLRTAYVHEHGGSENEELFIW